MESDAKRAVDLLIRDAYVITMDAERTIHPRGAVAVAGSRIVAVGPGEEVERSVRAARTIDARGAAVHPGFVDCHAHVTFHLVRGAFGDACPIDVFARAQLPYADLIDDEEFWRSETICNHLCWYAPAVGNMVREQKDAEYHEKGDPLSRQTIRTQHAIVELASYSRGG